MWVSKIDLNNFRSYVSGSLELSKSINLIVGQNNSGKSTILKSVAWLQNGSPISGQDIRKMEQSGSVGLVLVDSKRYFSQVSESPMSIIINCSNERLTVGGSGGLSTVNYDLQEGVRNTYNYNAFSSNYNYRIPNQEPNNFIYPYLSKRKVTHFEEAIHSEATNSVSGNFLNLSAKVDRLCDVTIPEHSEFINSCNEIIGFQLSAVASTSGKKPAQTINAHQRIYLEEMGEGVANLLGLIVDLCVAKDKLFLIEEPENDIHPRALKRLLELIEKKSKSNQFIITTHSNIVVKHLGSLTESKLFQVTMHYEDRIPTSKVEEVQNLPEARLAVLDDLGYDLFDFGIWSGWLFLEESSAERIIREYLIPWFVPKLVNKLRTIAANGKDDVEPKFQDFQRLFLFVHLEPIYGNSAWVIIDDGVEEKAIIDKLIEKFPSWDSSHFRQFSKHDFESYYPTQFKPNLREEIDQISNTRNKSDKRKLKKDMLDEFLIWIKENDTIAKDAIKESASEVIGILQEIESSIIKTIKPIL